MRKLIVLFLVIFLTFIIYKLNENNLIDYMSIGDSLDLGINSYGNNTYSYHDYLKNYLHNNNLLHKTSFFYSKSNYKIKDLLNDIKDNKEIIYDDKNYNIKKELREADLITICIGMDELINKIENNITSSDIDTLINDMDLLISNIKKFSSSNIVLIGYYNPYLDNIKVNKIFSYVNNKYKELATKYKIIYIDILNFNKEYLPNYKDYHLNSKGYLKIASKIIEKLDY